MDLADLMLEAGVPLAHEVLSGRFAHFAFVFHRVVPEVVLEEVASPLRSGWNFAGRLCDPPERLVDETCGLHWP